MIDSSPCSDIVKIQQLMIQDTNQRERERMGVKDVKIKMNNVRREGGRRGVSGKTIQEKKREGE